MSGGHWDYRNDTLCGEIFEEAQVSFERISVDPDEPVRHYIDVDPDAPVEDYYADSWNGDWIG